MSYFDKITMRKTYWFSHSICQGGYVYSHKTKGNKTIENKFGLRNAFDAGGKKFELIDMTIKIYDYVFFFFFMMKPKIKPIELINAIQRTINSFGELNSEYLPITVYDLQEEYVRKDLKKWGFEFDNG